MNLPHKKPPKRELDPQKKNENRAHARQSICVEHGIGKLKIWQIFSQRFRNSSSEHSLILKNIAGLSNFMYA